MTPRGLLVKVGSLLRAERADGAENQELDAALADLEAALPDDAPAAPDDAELALARFGAVVVGYFVPGFGWLDLSSVVLQKKADHAGVVPDVQDTRRYALSPGIADAVARLLKEESHA